FFRCLPLPPTSTLFPYTTLFRSLLLQGHLHICLQKPVCRFCRSDATSRIFFHHDIHLRQYILHYYISTALLYCLLYIFRWLSARSEEHTSELQSRENIVCRLLLE